jgi:hypothetical protein
MLLAFHTAVIHIAAVTLSTILYPATNYTSLRFACPRVLQRGKAPLNAPRCTKSSRSKVRFTTHQVDARTPRLFPALDAVSTSPCWTFKPKHRRHRTRLTLRHLTSCLLTSSSPTCGTCRQHKTTRQGGSSSGKHESRINTAVCFVSMMNLGWRCTCEHVEQDKTFTCLCHCWPTC